MRSSAPWLLAPVAGALWAACFGREPLAVAPWLALVPLFLLLGTARSPLAAFGLGWLHGLAFWLASIPWIAPTLETFGGLPAWLAVVLLVGLALYLGLFTAGFAALGSPLWQRGGWPALAGLPALWVSLEVLRGWLFTGFPWNLAAYAWTAVPGALPLAAWLGVWGVGLVAVAANAAVAFAFGSRPGRRRARPAVAVLLAALFLLPLAGRFAVPPGRLGPEAELAASRPVRIVQPAIYNQVTYDPEVGRAGYERLLRLSEQACDLPGALVVWPESAAWPFELGRDPELDRGLEALVERTGCSLLVNSTRRTSGPDGEVRYFNAVYLIERGGAAGHYDKRHLVPFGEYVPLAGVFTFIDRLARSAGDYSPADEVRLLPWGAEQLGAAICFEITFPGEVADLVRAGASVLVTVTNDAWYGDTAAPWQHFQAARWRAAETRRPMLRAAITGVSGVIAPDGSVRQSLGVGEAGVLRARISGRRDLSPFARAPWAVPAAAGALAVFAIVASRRSRP